LVQDLLRHANVSTTLGLYAQSVEFVYGRSRGIDAAGDFAERFESGKLSFTGDPSVLSKYIQQLD